MCIIYIQFQYFFNQNKPMSKAHRPTNPSNFADNPTIKIGMGQHHPTTAFVILYPVASRNCENLY